MRFFRETFTTTAYSSQTILYVLHININIGVRVKCRELGIEYSFITEVGHEQEMRR